MVVFHDRIYIPVIRVLVEVLAPLPPSSCHCLPVEPDSVQKNVFGPLSTTAAVTIQKILSFINHSL